jgi:hypothetical protein
VRPPRGALAAVVALVLLGGARPAAADEADFRRVTDYLWLLGGAAAGFVAHESGHLVIDYVLGTHPIFVGVKSGPFPFFAIEPKRGLTPRKRYATAAAGFNTQHLYSEIILNLDPEIRAHSRPFLKGMLAFHVALSVGYAVTGFAGAGPPQSDVNAMARGSGWPSWAIGLMLLAPAALDTYRYFVADSRWAPQLSIVGKLTLVGVTFTF